MKKKETSISVIIPVYNGEKFIVRALSSVLRQGFPSLEIIVVNDGSTDGTEQLVQRLGYDIKYIYQENQGPAAARNRGLEIATGEFISFLDADDVWPDNRLAALLAPMTENPSCEIALGQLQYVADISRTDGQAERVVLSEPHLAYNLSAALFRRRAFERVGGFDETLRHADDWDWYVRAQECGIEPVILPHVTLLAYRHRDNLSNQQTVGHRYVSLMIKKALDRRRSLRVE